MIKLNMILKIGIILVAQEKKIENFLIKMNINYQKMN